MPDLTDSEPVTITVAAPAAPNPPPPPATPATPAPTHVVPPPVSRPHAPQARNDSARVTGGKGVTIKVLGNDVIEAGERVTVTVGDPEHGTARVLADGSILYTPDPGFAGKDRFSYTITGPSGSTSAVVEVIVEKPAGSEAPAPSASWLGGPLLGGPAKPQDVCRRRPSRRSRSTRASSS